MGAGHAKGPQVRPEDAPNVVATVAGGLVAADQGHQTVGRSGPTSGVRVLAPELLPTGPWDGVYPPEVAEARKLPVDLDRDARVATAAALRAVGYRVAHIAQALSVSPSTVKLYLARAREIGALNDVARDLRTRALPQAVENLIKGLDKGDKDYTLKTLEGLGEFVRHSKDEHQGGPGATMAFQVNFVNAPVSVVEGHMLPATANGMVVGVPRD